MDSLSLIVGGTVFALSAIIIDVLFLNVVILSLAGLACFIGSLLVWLGVVPSTLFSVLVVDAAAWVCFTALLWRWGYLLNGKSRGEEVITDRQSYLVLSHDLKAGEVIHGRFSGVDWDIILDNTSLIPFIPAGSKVEITNSEVGLLTVKAC